MRPPFSYFGGKQNMVSDILPLVPPCAGYIEPFCGGAALFWAKPKAEFYVLNDKNRGLVALYRTLSNKESMDALCERVDATCFARDEHGLAKRIYLNPDEYTELDLAWAVYIMSSGFCHNYKIADSFSICKVTQGNRTFTWSARKKELLEYRDIYRKMMEYTTVENDDAVKVIRRYDTKDNFFFCDPPYPGTSMGHYGGYTIENFQELLDTLANIKGKFMLTCFLNDSLQAFIDTGKYEVKVFEYPISALQRREDDTAPRTYKKEYVVMNYRPEIKRQITLY